jgi:mRNA interferase RelE/StbE
MKTVTYTIEARGQLAKLPAKVRAQIEGKVNRYAVTGAGDVKALVGRPGVRLRSGDYRVIFIEDEAAVRVRAVGDRKLIYD